MYRRNPLQNPRNIIQGIIDSLLREIDNKKRGSSEALHQFYEEPSEHRVRWMLEYLGDWAAFEDVVGYYQELLDALQEDPTALAILLEALVARAEHIVLNPVQVQRRFYEMERQAGVDFEGISFANIEYGDYFAHPVDQFIYNYLHRFTFWIFHGTLQKLLAANRSPDWHTYDGQLVNLRHQEMATNLTEAQLQNILDDINSIISGRTSYGLRNSTENSLDSTKLSWSNGSKSWNIWSSYYDTQLVNRYVHGGIARRDRLDANIIVVPYPPPVVELLLSSLYPLPLYQYSYEAKMEKRRAGYTGPLVTDKEAKRIIISIAKIAANAYQKLVYGEEALDVEDQHWMVSRRAQHFFGDLLKAKTERDEEKFKELLLDLTNIELPPYLQESSGLERLNIEVPASFYGRLVNWFQMLSFD